MQEVMTLGNTKIYLMVIILDYNKKLHSESCLSSREAGYIAANQADPSNKPKKTLEN